MKDLFGWTRLTCPIGQVKEFASPLRWVLVNALGYSHGSVSRRPRVDRFVDRVAG
jgi:hypothetical protein